MNEPTLILRSCGMRILLLCCFLLVGLFVSGQSVRDSIIPGDLLVEDLRHLQALIREIHPSPYRYCSPEDEQRAFQMAEQSVSGGMTFYDFAAVVGRTMRVYRDSHTTLNFSALLEPYAADDGHFLDFRVWSVGNHIYIREDGAGILPPGTRLLGINGANAERIHGMVSDYSIYEGRSITAYKRITDALFRRFCAVRGEVGENNTLQVLYPGDELPMEVDYPGKTLKELKKEAKKKEGDPVYDLLINDSLKYAVLKIGSFSYKGPGKFSRFLKRSFRKINRAEVKYLAIDLRDNTGGKSSRTEELYSYLTNGEEVPLPARIIARQSNASLERFNQTFSKWNRLMLRIFRSKDRDVMNYIHLAEMPVGEIDTVDFSTADQPKEKLRFNGNKALFINGLSGSASVSFAGMFKLAKQGPIIGEACLGPPGGTWGNPVFQRLENTKMPILIASIRFSISTYDPQINDPVMPDIPAIENARDLRLQRDIYLQRLESLIRGAYPGWGR